MRTRNVWIASCLAALGAYIARPAEQPQAPAASKGVALHEGTLEIEAGQQWSTRAAVPKMGDGEGPVLSLRARADTGGSGGCNRVLQVLIDDVPLSESVLRRRLVNKLPWFDPPGTEYHFSWYDHRRQGWMTIFSRSCELNWGGTGRDYDFLFDLSGLVVLGEPVKITFGHIFPGLPAAIRRDRAPLVLDRVMLGAMRSADLARLRRQVEGSDRMRPVTVRAALPTDAKPGPRPYEVVWSGRPESPRAQVAFDDLSGWAASVSGDLEVSIEASVEQRLWRKQLAKVAYTKGSQASAILLRPDEPIAIEEPFDAASLWLYADFDRRKDRHPQVTAHLEDAAGRDFVVDLGHVRNSYWVLLHGVLSSRERAFARYPLRFVGLSVSIHPPKEGQRALHLESLAFYQRNRRPFVKDTRPAGPTFPTSDLGMLPTPSADAPVRVEAAGQGAIFHRGKLRLRVEPKKGVLDGVSARWGDGAWFRPLAGGRLKLDPTVGRAEDGQVVSSRVENGRLVVRWRSEVEWQAAYSLRGRTLVLDVECSGGAAEGLRFGQVEGLADARAVEVPYLTYGTGYGPWVACGSGLFVSVLADWYHCECSRIDGAVPKADGESIALMNGTDYLPLTNGRRNDLRERVLVTVSPEFADVLPNIPHPASPHMERLAKYVFIMVGHIRPTFLKTIKRYGLDHVIACDFARFYVEHFPEGFAGRWRPHPLLTMEQIQDYRKVVKGLGYLFGAYSDIRDYFPLNEFWDENCVSLDSRGDLVEGWYGNFRTKPNYLSVMARLVGEKVHEHYPADSVYMDTHTCVGAIACDFEAGVPGAGIARDQVYYNAECILETGKWYGTTMSEGRARWMYAGIADMDYASPFTSRPGHEVPPLVDFDLLKIHPLNLGTMMGYGPSIFFRRNADKLGPLYRDSGAGLAPIEFYQYVSASLAYGHMLMLGYSYMPPVSRMIHLYALMQGVQTEYLTDTVSEIHYHDGRKLVTTSQALFDDTQKLGRVRVKYSGGLVVHVNYNAERSWSVEGYELAPFGWLIVKPGKILAFSALVDGRRVDCTRCPEYVYLNSGDRRAKVEALDVQGAVWLKREGSKWRLIPCGDLGRWESFTPSGLPAFQRDLRRKPAPANRGCGEIAIDTAKLLGKAPTAVRVQARTESGETVPTRITTGRVLTVEPGEDVADYLLE